MDEVVVEGERMRVVDGDWAEVRPRTVGDGVSELTGVEGRRETYSRW